MKELGYGEEITNIHTIIKMFAEQECQMIYKNTPIYIPGNNSEIQREFQKTMEETSTIIK
jgi:hypothetical protein